VLIQVEQKNLGKLRRNLLLKQGGMCPILKQVIPPEEAVIDHQHKTKAENIGENGAGLIRGVLHRSTNALEGKIVNNFKRLGLHKYINLPDFLRNLADYLEQRPTQFIHPSEKQKALLLKKSSYNKLKKAYKGKARFPEFNKNGKQKMTVGLEKLFKEYKIEPEYY